MTTTISLEGFERVAPIFLAYLRPDWRSKHGTKVVHSWNFGDIEALAVELLCVPCLDVSILSFATPPDRLENEHLGNVDQYRVTREVPLPYSLDHDDQAQMDAASDDEIKYGSKWSRRRTRTISPVVRSATEAIALQ